MKIWILSPLMGYLWTVQVVVWGQPASQVRTRVEFG